MKRRQHTPEQVIRKVNEGQKLLAEGKTLDEVAKHPEVPPSLAPLGETSKGA